MIVYPREYAILLIIDNIFFRRVKIVNMLSDSNRNGVPGSISDHVFQALRKQILLGELKPGERLLVLDIANKFDISQAPVREALERLKQEGLIIGRNNKGSIVADITLEEIRDVYAIRMLVEGYAVRETMASINPSELKHLRALLQEMKHSSETKDSVRIVELDMDFHEFFYKHCGNELLYDMWRHMRSKLVRFIAITNMKYSPDVTVDTHSALFAALESGDIEETVKLFLHSLQFNENSQFYRQFKTPGSKP